MKQIQAATIRVKFHEDGDLAVRRAIKVSQHDVRPGVECYTTLLHAGEVVLGKLVFNAQRVGWHA